jgi:hypothetical protein
LRSPLLSGRCQGKCGEWPIHLFYDKFQKLEQQFLQGGHSWPALRPERI